ncbi:sensor histidine kinase [Bowmanella dokdonensis]|uniref:histidine kinase n=1 Tax=Bowmanella dokdonensis TaxID=751969 RepID=A0A939DL31_9ALTE|nr:ATP-binding protein [Bowmanella dokdonensis]MBN7824529.1 hypothetical protein [Bowmanella dokdonensis]
MNIKTRILVFVILFEVVAYTTLQLFAGLIYKEALDDFKQSEIQAVFARSTSRIDSLIGLMEQKATDLALQGEELYLLRQSDTLSLEDINVLSRRLLEKQFASFPQAIGGGLWYEANRMDQRHRYYGPYVFKQNEQVKFTWDLSRQDYDYLNQGWYRLARDNDWGRQQSRYRPVFWTAPYRDDAGSFSLMMTVDAVMLDSDRQPLGMATVDWSLHEMTAFLDTIKVSPGSTPFLIHQQSGLILSYPLDASLIMQSAGGLNWAAPLLADNRLNQFIGLSDTVRVPGLEDIQQVFYQVTEHGFIVGSLVPIGDLRRQIEQVSRLTLFTGAAIGLAFILIMIFILRVLFSPFDEVLKTIRHSISYDKEQHVQLKQVEYDKVNEFTPIIRALNDVYLQIKTYVNEITDTNAKLRRSERQINRLNAALEQKVALRTRELESKTREVTESLEKLRQTQQQLVQNEKHAALGRLVAGVAHQINTPLGVCVTAASMLALTAREIHDKAHDGKVTRGEFEESYEKILASADLININLNRATELISSFKQVAVDNQDQNKRLFDAAEYVQNILLSLRSRTESTPHQIRLQCDGPISLYAPPGALTQILTQLIDNALYHAFNKDMQGVIDISLCREDTQLLLSVCDNGCGMEPTVREQIFAPFFTTRADKFGSGLGMHIIYNLVIQQLEGSIDCRSEPGNGTCFFIRIPLATAELQQESNQTSRNGA